MSWMQCSIFNVLILYLVLRFTAAQTSSDSAIVQSSMSLITVEATVEPMDDTTSSSVDMRTLLPTEVITSMASSIMVVMESTPQPARQAGEANNVGTDGSMEITNALVSTSMSLFDIIGSGDVTTASFEGSADFDTTTETEVTTLPNSTTSTFESDTTGTGSVSESTVEISTTQTSDLSTESTVSPTTEQFTSAPGIETTESFLSDTTAEGSTDLFTTSRDETTFTQLFTTSETTLSESTFVETTTDSTTTMLPPSTQLSTTAEGSTDLFTTSRDETTFTQLFTTSETTISESTFVETTTDSTTTMLPPTTELSTTVTVLETTPLSSQASEDSTIDTTTTQTTDIPTVTESADETTLDTTSISSITTSISTEADSSTGTVASDATETTVSVTATTNRPTVVETTEFTSVVDTTSSIDTTSLVDTTSLLDTTFTTEASGDLETQSTTEIIVTDTQSFTTAETTTMTPSVFASVTTPLSTAQEILTISQTENITATEITVSGDATSMATDTTLNVTTVQITTDSTTSQDTSFSASFSPQTTTEFDGSTTATDVPTATSAFAETEISSFSPSTSLIETTTLETESETSFAETTSVEQATTETSVNLMTSTATSDSSTADTSQLVTAVEDTTASSSSIATTTSINLMTSTAVSDSSTADTSQTVTAVEGTTAALSSTAATTNTGVSVTAVPTTQVISSFTNNSIAVLSLTITDATLSEQALATALAEAYAELVSNFMTGTRRRKRAANATVESNGLLYTVQIIKITPAGSTRTVTFYVIEESRTSGTSMIPTGSFVAGTLLNDINRVIALLRSNNINAMTVLFTTMGICQTTSDIAAIDLRLINADGLQTSDSTQAESFINQISTGLAYLRAFTNTSTCRRPGESITYQICAIVTQNECDVRVLFLQNTNESTGNSTIMGLRSNAGMDMQLYAVALRSFVRELPFPINLNDVSMVPPVTSTTTLSPITVTEAVTPGWVLPVVIVLAVLCFIILLVLIFLLYYYCCRRKKMQEEEITFTGYREVSTAKDVDEAPTKISQTALPAAVAPSFPAQTYQKELVREPSHPPLPSYKVIEKPLNRSAPLSESPSTDSDIQQQVYATKTKKRKKPTAAKNVGEPLFAEASNLSNKSEIDERGRFSASLQPVSLPPIQTRLVSEQLRDNIKNSQPPPSRKRKQRKPSSEVHKFNPAIDDETAEVYQEAQERVDEVLEPTLPTLFQLPKKKFHKRHGKLSMTDPISTDPDLNLLMSSAHPAQFTSINPSYSPRRELDETTATSKALSPEATRAKIASLLEDAFSLVSPSTRNSLSPFSSPRSQVEPLSQVTNMPQPHGRGSSTDPNSARSSLSPRSDQSSKSNDRLFTRTQPPLVRTSLTNDGPNSLYIPPTASPSGQPTYVTPIKKVPNPPGNSGVWTPYRAFDEVSKIREELENPIFPLGPLPNSPPSPSNTNNVTPPSTTTSLIDENGHVGLPTSSLKDDDDSGSSSSRSLMKGIKSEIAKLANLPSPVRSLSPENTTPRYDPPNLDEQR